MLLKACVNGARRPGEHAALPFTAAEIARDVGAVVAAGAGAVHVHVKDVAGADTFDGDALAEVLSAGRVVAPAVPLGVTTGAWALPDATDRVRAISSWPVLPDFASVNWHEAGADEVAAALLDRGVGVEAGLWHEMGVAAWLASPVRERCMRVLIELADGFDEDRTGVEAMELLSRVRPAAQNAAGEPIPVLLHGEGSSCWPALRLALSLGLDTRIGLEDTLVMPDGTPAPNNQALVVAAAGLAGGALR